jgi:polyisoprenoid-binding protein YceI
MEVPADFASNPAAAKSAKVEVTIPVRSLKSGKTAMNNIMWEAMKMKDHPNIVYKLIELTPKAGGAQGTSAQFDAKGTLTVAGVTRTNTMPVTIEKVGDDKAKATGTTTVKMTDFGIKPPAPTVGLGFIKTGDDVKIAFEFNAEKAAALPLAAPKILPFNNANQELERLTAKAISLFSFSPGVVQARGGWPADSRALLGRFLAHIPTMSLYDFSCQSRTSQGSHDSSS